MTKTQTRLALAAAVLFALGFVWTLRHLSALDPEMELDHNFNFVQRDGIATFGSQWLSEENGWHLGIDTQGNKLSQQSAAELAA